MAAASTTTTTHIFNENNTTTNNNGGGGVSREEIQAAIAKAVELRAIHAALMHANITTTNNKNSSVPPSRFLSSSSPVSLPISHLSAQDYPVFTPSYEDDVTVDRSRTISETWDEFNTEQENGYETVTSDCNKDDVSIRKRIQSHICQVDDQKSVTGSCVHSITVLHTSPGAEFFKSSRVNNPADSKSVSSCNRYKPAAIVSDSENMVKGSTKASFVAPMTDSHSSVQSQPKNRRMMSWLFPKLKRKHKNEASPNRAESEEVSQVFKDLGILSIESLKRELMEANENRDAALMEVVEMKSSMGELKQKLESLEGYCLELKKALKQATQSKNSQLVEKLGTIPTKRGKSMDISSRENVMPVSEDVMVEGFLQIVSEARLSVKQFCKTLTGQIDDTDMTLMDSLNLLLQPYKLSLNSKHSKAVFYHLEAMISQSLYQDFENCVFQKNGSPKHLDPEQARQAQFSSFAALRNLSWNEVLRKGTKYYSEEFSKFCDQKMSCIITTLNWTRPWPEQLLQAFFVAAKCIWLLHLLAFSFNPPLGILRVEENRSFDPHYMEDMDKQRSHGASRVKVLVMPGFYVQDRILKCKVLCRHRTGG